MENGIITFLDILGWKGIWQRQGEKATDNLQQLVRAANSFIAAVQSLQAGLRATPVTKGNYTYQENGRPDNFRAICISDTIALVSWPYDPTTTQVQIRPDEHAAICSALIKYGLQLQLPLRGAIAQGAFAVSEQGYSVVGPAVDEVAAWHEQLEWIGVHYCPSVVYTRGLATNTTDLLLRVPAVATESLPAKTIRFTGECVDWTADWTSPIPHSDIFTHGKPIEKTPYEPEQYGLVPQYIPQRDEADLNGSLTEADLKKCFLEMGPLGPDIFAKYYNTLDFYKKRVAIRSSEAGMASQLPSK